MTFYKLNKKYKDRLFRLIFQDKKELLELYNAVNNSQYTNPEELTITTIEDVVYMGMKNDLSFIIGDVMNLYEHQSSFSPNLPLRGLFYFSSLYKEHIESVRQKLYTDSPLRIPFPQYIVFYNGTKDEPERQELKLSNLFIRPVRQGADADSARKHPVGAVDNPNTREWHSKRKSSIADCSTITPALECTALVLNINYGHNQALLDKCKVLGEYSRFVSMIRSHVAEGMDFEESVEFAVDECIEKGILSEILRKNRTEVIDMILTEYNEEEFREFLKEESWKEGHESGKLEGISEGIEIGKSEGIEIGKSEGIEIGKIKGAIEGTIKTCLEFQIDKNKIIEKLMQDFSLSKEEAAAYVEKYSK